MIDIVFNFFQVDIWRLFFWSIQKESIFGGN
jgi:hypothetical protein